MDSSRFRLKATSGWRSTIKLALRRFVVATSGTPLRPLYLAIYRAHVRYAVHKLSGLPGVQSIYLTGGVASGDILPGISDIDITVNGEWTPDEEARVVATLKGLSNLSPLYDTLLSQCTQSLSVLCFLYETDFYFQYLFDMGRTRWKRVYGEDVFALLPPASPERTGGGQYMVLRTWWSYFFKSAFGYLPDATDGLFRLSIPYKAVAMTLNCQSYFEGRGIESKRSLMLQKALASASGDERSFLERLIASGNARHLHFEGDIRQEAFPFLMRHLEATHKVLGNNPIFAPVPVQGMTIDASAAEMMVASSTRRYVEDVVQLAKQQWSGYRAAFLVPSLSFFYPDDLALLLEVKPEDLPRVTQLRELCRFALDNAGALPQRVALFLLLPEAAYQLEITSSLELWHHTLCPQANPEVFALIERQDFAVDGNARLSTRAPYFSRFARDLMKEDLCIRRQVSAKVAHLPDVPSLEMLRGIWYQIRLEILDRSLEAGSVLIPMTVPSIERQMQKLGPEAAGLFARLREAYASEIDGTPVDIKPLLPGVMTMFAASAPPEASVE